MSKVRADNYADRLGTGAPVFPNGVNVTGVVTATSAIIGAAVTINNSGVDIAGIVTATSFEGSLIGTAASSTSSAIAYNLTGEPNITVGIVTANSYEGNFVLDTYLFS